MLTALPLKTASTISLLGVMLIASAYLRVPGMKHLPGLTSRPFANLLVFRGAAGVPPPALTKPVVPLPVNHEPSPKRAASVPFLDVPTGSLDTFFSALRRTESGERGAVTRVLHYGDSPTTADSITSDVRRLFHARFGDGGHGLLLIAPPWAWYGHQGMKLDAKGWEIRPASANRATDGFHGLGGVSFVGSEGATSDVRFPQGHTHGVVYYLAQPGGGSFSVTSGEHVLTTVNTASPDKAPGFADFPIPSDSTTLGLRVTSGTVRLFGYRFDKPGPGVQYSSLGINGAQVQMVVRYFAADQWSAALRHEEPDLVVLNYGTNESVYPAYLDKQYPGELRTVIERIRKALPHTSILVMSPMDRGVLDASGEIVTPPALVHLIDIQKRVAAETGCAFFNTFAAMGGAGTMNTWYHSQPRLVSADFMHPFPAGAAKVGSLVESALTKSYELDTGDRSKSAGSVVSERR